ncbi:MAG: IS1182 family transposase [Planctomycetaceae bacterium]
MRCFSNHQQGGRGDDSSNSDPVQKVRFVDPPLSRESPEWVQLDQQVGSDHFARWIDQAVDSLDFTPVLALYRGTGSDPLPPQLLLKGILLLVYSGVLSPAVWCRSFRENLVVQWLTRGCAPSRSTLYDFRDRLRPVFESLSNQVIRQAQAAGFLTAGVVAALDGTVVRSQGSRHRLANLKRLTKYREALTKALQQDALGLPVEVSERWMAKTPGGRESQAARFDHAATVLAERLRINQQRPKAKRLEERQVTVSLSDPEAAVGRDKEKVHCACYNTQFQVDQQSLLIITYDTLCQSSDVDTLPRMLDKTRDVLGFYPSVQLADAGYVSLLDIQDAAARGVNLIAPYQESEWTEKKRTLNAALQLGKERFVWLPDERTYRCPQGHKLQFDYREKVPRRSGEKNVYRNRYRCATEHCQMCPLKAQCCPKTKTGRTVKRFDNEELIEAHRAKMQTAEAKTLNRQRGAIIERAFGDMKAHRNLRRFHGRGRARAHAEIGMVVLVANLITLRRLHRVDPNPNKNTT